MGPLRIDTGLVNFSSSLFLSIISLKSFVCETVIHVRVRKGGVKYAMWGRCVFVLCSKVGGRSKKGRKSSDAFKVNVVRYQLNRVRDTGCCS